MQRLAYWLQRSWQMSCNSYKPSGCKGCKYPSGAISETGAAVVRDERHTVRLNGKTIGSCVVDNSYVKKMRASYYLLGALLGKYHHAEVALPVDATSEVVRSTSISKDSVHLVHL